MNAESCRRLLLVRSSIDGSAIMGAYLFNLAFIEAGKPKKAMVAYEKNLQWRELFDLAFLGQTPAEEVSDMAYRVSG